jgi:hypothetical protein
VQSERSVCKIRAVEERGRIVIRRPEGGYRDLRRSYRIEVDGVGVGKVAEGERVEVTVAPGQHNIRAVIDWSGSPVLPIDVAAGQTARLVVESAGDMVAAVSQIWKRHSWLTLKPE